MPRSLRMYGKKRGNRRTGSKLWASLGEALFFAFFLVAGSFFLMVLLATVVQPEWRVNHEFRETEGEVVATRLDQPSDGDEKLYRPAVKVRYTVGEKTYDDWTYDIHFDSGRELTRNAPQADAARNEFRVGERVSLWYDPADPGTAAVVRGYSWLLWLLLLLPIAFILIGGIGLVVALFHWGKSIEHRVVSTQQARRLNPLTEEQAPRGEFPGVPLDPNITNSPGTRLKYRLPIDLSRGWRLLAVLLACIFWNSIVAVFAVIAINRHLDGRPEWLLTLFVLPFAAVGVAILYFFVRELLVTTGVGPTQIEISDHPWFPGRRYAVLMSQSGRLLISSIDLLLVCDEVATYRQGTDTRTERLRVFEQPVFHHEQIEVEPSRAFEHQGEVEIPAECMHSFKATHNEVQWRVLIRADVAGWPPFERTFPVVVCPAFNGRET